MVDDQYIYYCGQESLRRNGVALRVNKSPHAGLNQVYAPTTDAEEDEIDQSVKIYKPF